MKNKSFRILASITFVVMIVSACFFTYSTLFNKARVMSTINLNLKNELLKLKEQQTKLQMEKSKLDKQQNEMQQKLNKFIK